MAVPLACGCGSKEEIRTYTVEKQEQAAAPALSAGDSAATDRMLGAIVPAGEQSWFFKVTGPAEVVDKNATQINKFFQTIQLSAGAEKPVWKTPEGWQELGASGMRAATLKIPTDNRPLEISVIASSGSLIDNVNRWRGQLQLPPMDEAALQSTVKEAKAGDAKMWLVDLTGKAAPVGTMAPFAGGGAQAPGNAPFAGGGATPGAVTEPGSPPPDLPPGHPPVAADGGPVDSPAAAPFAFTAPDSWQPQPASGMRKAAFLVKEGDKQALITVIDLPASAPSVASPLENVNRWRKEIGLAPITEGELTGLVQEMQVDRKPSKYFELIPDAAKPAESQATEATIAAAVPVGDMIWFFKFRGERDLVVAQRDHFKSFLDSIRFASDGGAGDGN
jgi:hypothetical protein